MYQVALIHINVSLYINNIREALSENRRALKNKGLSCYFFGN